jgi:N-acetylmuramoyl-L-alanine amidase
MIRNGDTFVPLRGRIQKASKQNADIFISIHADAAVNRRAKGSSVYVLSQNGATSEAARILAKRENEADKIGGVSLENKDDVLKSVLVDLSQTATIDASIDLAEDILLELGQVGNVLRDKVEQAGFAVLKSPDIPSVLVETAFISNPQEEKRLKTASHQQKLAVAILKGLRRYAKDHSPPNAILANNQSSGSAHATYTIKSGDTLSGIAIRYQVSLVDLRRVNSLRSDKLRVGQVLKLPATVTAGT